MKFTCEINMDNAAFKEDTPDFELRRILRRISNQVSGSREGVCLDYNGNRVGEWRIQ